MPSQESLKAHWHGALRKNGWPIGIAAIVFAGLTFFAHLSPALAFLSFAMLTAALLIGHVALGALQSETSPALAAVLGAGMTAVVGLHLAAGAKERRKDTVAAGYLPACDLEQRFCN